MTSVLPIDVPLPRAGLMLVGFVIRPDNTWLRRYFGFMYQPQGQLIFLLGTSGRTLRAHRRGSHRPMAASSDGILLTTASVAGNLAWSSGFLGVLTALLTNFNAIVGWYTARQEQPGSAAGPSWLGGAFGGGARDPANEPRSTFEDEIL